MLLHSSVSPYWIFFILVGVGETSAIDTGLCWTDWINRHLTAEGVDNEVLSSSDTYIYGVCSKPLAVDVARIDGLPVKEKLNCGFYGCVCRDINQKPGVKCADYKVRFLCLCHDLYDKRGSGHQSSLLCQGSANHTFECPLDRVISVKSAYYGTIWLSKCGAGLLNSVCRKEFNDVLKEMQALCEGKRICSVPGPPYRYGGPNCGLVPKHLHVEITCAERCLRNGKTYYTGNEVIDEACTVRCTCVKGGRFVCIPLCPVKYGVVCPNKGVVRLRKKEVSTSPRCSCLLPTCFTPRILGCRHGEMVLAAGQKFHKNCQEECQCLGQGRIRCQSLCKPSEVTCGENLMPRVKEMATAYSECRCRQTHCIPLI